MRLASWIFLLTAGVSCILGCRFAKQPGPEPGRVEPANTVTVFITGSELGALKPCGCSGGQLGGLDRRAAVFNAVPPAKRLILDTGMLVESAREQDLLKFNIIIQAFDLLDYNLVNLTEKDIEIAKNLGLSNNISALFNVISPHHDPDVNAPAKFTKKFLLADKPLAVTVASFDAQSSQPEQIAELFAPQPAARTVNILIINQYNADLIASLAEQAIVDCVICPPQSDEPMLINSTLNKPLVVSSGRLGKYVGKLQITPDPNSVKLELAFSAAAVIEDLPLQDSLVWLYKSYQQLLKDANLLESYPRFVLPDGLRYTGSKSCKQCHEYEYDKWSTKAHADAFSTLQKVGSQYDPECVLCHVVGLEYESGFVSQEKTAHLKNVGCENCHGPGSQHIETSGEAKTAGPMSDCTDCHTPEHSGEYAANELIYFEKIVHWREPNADSNVK